MIHSDIWGQLVKSLVRWAGAGGAPLRFPQERGALEGGLGFLPLKGVGVAHGKGRVASWALGS